MSDAGGPFEGNGEDGLNGGTGDFGRDRADQLDQPPAQVQPRRVDGGEEAEAADGSHDDA